MALPSYAMNQASFPELYERELVDPLFRPWAEMCLDEVELAAGCRLLDVACGTGIVARMARQRVGGGQIVGIDISEDMLAVARDRAPDIDWRVGDASALPLKDGELFDVVICQQGMQFFPDKPAAAAEMRRALVNGGRLAVSTWLSDDEIPFFRELREVAERHLGSIADQRYGFGEGEALAGLLRGTGFADVRVKRQTRTIRFDDGAPLLRLNAMALVGMSAGGMALDGAERQRLVEKIAEESVPVLRGYVDESGTRFELATNLATATR